MCLCVRVLEGYYYLQMDVNGSSNVCGERTFGTLKGKNPIEFVSVY